MNGNQYSFIVFPFLKEMMSYAKKEKVLGYILSVIYIQIGFWLKCILVALTGKKLAVKKKLTKDNVLLFGMSILQLRFFIDSSYRL